MREPLSDEEVERERLKRLVDFASFFQNTVEGPKILSYLKSSLDGNSYKPGQDALETAYRAGRRSVYLDIIAAVGEGQEVLQRDVVKPQPEAMMQVAIEDL